MKRAIFHAAKSFWYGLPDQILKSDVSQYFCPSLIPSKPRLLLRIFAGERGFYEISDSVPAHQAVKNSKVINPACTQDVSHVLSCAGFSSAIYCCSMWMTMRKS